LISSDNGEGKTRSARQVRDLKLFTDASLCPIWNDEILWFNSVDFFLHFQTVCPWHHPRIQEVSSVKDPLWIFVVVSATCFWLGAVAQISY
jgi:hypothetical protein